jgi:drug/metabolite transporter (DMT)-like permease
VPLSVLLLVLASALTHALWNAAIKRLDDPEAGALLIVAGAGLVSAALALASGKGLPPLESLPWVLASGGVEGLYFVTLTRALSRLPLGTAYGLTRGGGQLVTWPVSVMWMGERAGPVAVLGASVLIAGLWMRVRAPFDRVGLGWSALCAVAIGFYPISYKMALHTGSPPFVLFAASMALSLPLQWLALGPQRGGRVRAAASRRGLLAGAAVACAASFLLFLLALGLGDAGRASAVRNVSIAFATVLGAWSGESLDARAWWAAAAITVGAVVVSAS